jgi:hypothetical protein
VVLSVTSCYLYRWVLNLRPVLGTVGSSSVGGKQSIDAQKATWQKGPLHLRLATYFLVLLTRLRCLVSKKGHAPTPRCGAVMTVYKNKGVLFGGVFDDEGMLIDSLCATYHEGRCSLGIQHSMVSTFYNDMYAFDLERK